MIKVIDIKSLDSIHTVCEYFSSTVENVQLKIDIDYKYRNLESIKLELTGKDINFSIFGTINCVYDELIKYLDKYIIENKKEISIGNKKYRLVSID